MDPRGFLRVYIGMKIALYAFVLFLMLCPMPVWASPLPPSGKIVFEVLRGGQSFGTHRIDVSEDESGRRVAEIDIRLSAGLGPVTLFRYEHRNREVWDGDTLLSLESRTNDDGTDYFVQAERQEDGYYGIKHQDAAYDAPAPLFPTSYWNPAYLEVDRLLNTQKGHIEDIVITDKGTEMIETAFGKIAARRYDIAASVPITVWYAEDSGQWAGLAFTARGQDITYRRLTPFDE